MRVEFRLGPIDGCVENPDIRSALELPELRVFPSTDPKSDEIFVYRKVTVRHNFAYYQYEPRHEEGGASEDTPPTPELT